MRSFGDVFEEYVRRNLLASQRVFEAAAAAGVRVVFASSSSIYGDAERYPTPEDDRAAADLAVRDHEARLRATRPQRTPQGFGLDAVVLRYFTVYGPRQRPDMAFARIVDALVSGSPFELFGDGGQSRSFTYVADVIDATIAAMERAPAGSVYNVGGGEEATMREAIETLERVSGRTLDLVESPAAAGDVSARTRTRPGSGATSAGARRPHSKTACEPSGNGPRLESPRLE